MYFKIENGKIQKKSYSPIVGGFEQTGLKYECNSTNLVVVSDTEVRDITQEELDARTPVDPLPALKQTYKTARNACPATTKAAFVALENILKELLGNMGEKPPE